MGHLSLVSKLINDFHIDFKLLPRTFDDTSNCHRPNVVTEPLVVIGAGGGCWLLLVSLLDTIQYLK